MRSRFLFIALCLFFLIGFSAFGQIASIGEIQSAFETLTNDFAQTLPALSTTGLNWSDAYIGGFPHFGVGATLGVAMIPYDSIKNAAAVFDFSLDNYIPSYMRTAGMPLPTWCVDGRIGGFIFPFDIGLKAGFLPPDVHLPANVTFDYLLLGADVRYGILEDSAATPGLSVGLGINWLSGSVGVLGVTPAGTITIPGYTDVTVSQGNFIYEWQALTLDLKAQISKNLVFITVTAGVGATYSVYAKAGGGLEATVTHGYTPAEVAAIKAAYPNLDLSGTNFKVSNEANGFSVRTFGGIQFNILIVKVDLNANYNFLSGSWGGSLNLRAQF